MTKRQFPNCRHQCDGQWMLSFGSVTARPCKCLAQQKAMRNWLVAAVAAVVAGIGIFWTLAR